MWRYWCQILCAAIVFFGTMKSVRAESNQQQLPFGVPFGASEAQIKSVHAGEPKHTAANGAERILVYPGEFAGEQVSVLYRLIQDKLYQVQYSFETKSRNCTAMQTAYQSASKELEKSLQSPLERNEGELKNCNADRSSNVQGVLSEVALSRDSGRIDLSVTYTSSALSELATRTTTHQVPK